MQHHWYLGARAIGAALPTAARHTGVTISTVEADPTSSAAAEPVATANDQHAVLARAIGLPEMLEKIPGLEKIR